MSAECPNCALLLARVAELSHLLDQVAALAMSQHVRPATEPRASLSSNGFREGAMGTTR